MCIPRVRSTRAEPAHLEAGLAVWRKSIVVRRDRLKLTNGYRVQKKPVGDAESASLLCEDSSGIAVIQVVLADSSAVYREGLVDLFTRDGRCDVLAHISDGRAAVDACRDRRPDLLLTDLCLPKLQGIDLLERVREASPKTRVLGMSRHFDAGLIWQALQAGADGLLCKSASFAELCDAVEGVGRGEVYLSASVQALLVRGAIRKGYRGEDTRWSQLTSREREVAQLLVEGYSPKRIARELFLSAKTVDSHRYQLLKRLGIRNVADLTRLAAIEGVIHIES